MSSGRTILRYFLLSGLWTLLAWFMSKNFASQDVWFLALCVVVFSTPLFLGALYLSAISQIQKLAVFSGRGRLYSILSGRILSVVSWLILAPLFGAALLVQMNSYRGIEWSLILLTIPAFILVFIMIRDLIVRDQIHPHLKQGICMRWAIRICPIIMTFTSLVFSWNFGHVPEVESLRLAVELRQAKASGMIGSALVYQISQWLAYYSGVKDFALSAIGQKTSIAPILCILIGQYILFYNACLLFSFFAIPSGEHSRALGRLTTDPVPAKLTGNRVMGISAIGTVLLIIYFNAFAKLDNWFRSDPKIATAVEDVHDVGKTVIEVIDGRYYREGTNEELQNLELEYAKRDSEKRSLLIYQANIACDKMRGNVDGFLDWYYSLAAEYGRLGSMLQGELESYITKQLSEELISGNPFDEFEVSVSETLAYAEEFKLKSKSILDKYSVTIINAEEFSFRRFEYSELAPVHKDLSSIHDRVSGATSTGVVVGSVSGVVAAKVVSTALSKGVIQVAAKAAVKVIATKFAGQASAAAASVAAGAALGSVAPGIGTAVGAGLGLIVGLGATVAVDKTALEIEEFLGREEFKSTIIDAIDCHCSDILDEISV